MSSISSGVAAGAVLAHVRSTAGRGRGGPEALSVALPDERSRGTMDAAAVLLALAVVDGYDLDAVVDEALGGTVAVVDGEEDLARPHGEHVGHARVVGVVHLDPLDLELFQGVQETPRHAADVDEGEVLVDHDELPVDVHGVAREIDLVQTRALGA